MPPLTTTTPPLLGVVVYPAMQSELENIYVARNGHMPRVSQWDLTGILWETSLKKLTQLAWTCFIPFPWVSLFLPKIPCADWIQNDHLEIQGDLRMKPPIKEGRSIRQGIWTIDDIMALPRQLWMACPLTLHLFFFSSPATSLWNLSSLIRDWILILCSESLES